MNCVTCCAVLLEPQLLDIMIVQFRNEKVSHHGSIPITIDCNVVALIVFEEGFHQPIKRTKQVVIYGSDITEDPSCRHVTSVEAESPHVSMTARGGRVRSTTPAEDRYIVLSAKRNRRTTAQQVANQFLASSGKQISRKTVARRLRGGGLYARRPVVCVPLTRQHRTARLQWCREHHNWTEQDWQCVLFSDESRFSLSSDCRRQLIWRESGTAYRPENIKEKDRYPTCSIMVWAGIMINGRTRLHVVANGTMTGQRYIEVLIPHVRLFRGAVGDKFVFMDDNATCHRTLAVQDCLDSEGIQRLVWPARSPDLNSIENVWDALGRQVAGRNYPPTNKNTLIRALTEEWDKLPQQLLNYVVQSMNQDGLTPVWRHRGKRTVASCIRHHYTSPPPGVMTMVAERLARHCTLVTTVDELWHRIEASWASVFVHAIQSMFDSIRRRIRSVILPQVVVLGTDFSGSIYPDFLKI
ncbi:transposable element Tc1 transposase [Trichonephila clavipes]|nr:transposable element Tc1 transposase [Trichonephila clavipes]